MKVYIVHSPIYDDLEDPTIEIHSAYLNRSKAMAERRKLNRKAGCLPRDPVYEVRELEVIE